ncbi:MAG: AAA family ATPase [Acetobacteraceae bacterium]
MLNGTDVAAELAPQTGDKVSSFRPGLRANRPALIAFVADSATEVAVLDGVGDVMPGPVDVRRGGVRAALAAMQTAASPSVLIVDVSREDQPLKLLTELAHVVEPDVSVLVVGDIDSVDFYRTITRGLGASDYLPKPIMADKIARHVRALVAGQDPGREIQAAGFVVVTGARGGVGATTLAVNLAGHLGVTLRRHTVLLDPDLISGDASFMLNVTPGPGLRTALEAPDRIDTLLAERAAQPAAERLHVLAGEDLPGIRPVYAPGGPSQLIAALRRRYNYIVADVPPRQDRLLLDLLAEQHHRVLVMAPSLASVRAILRLVPAPGAGDKAKRPLVILNRLGVAGGMPRREIEAALGFKVDVAIPDMPRKLGAAATMGELAIDGGGDFRKGILELAEHIGLSAAAGATALPASARPGLLRRLFRGAR